MSCFKWTQAKEIKTGDIVSLTGHEVEVSKVEISASKVNITTKIGHNGIEDQIYGLESWQEVKVKQ